MRWKKGILAACLAAGVVVAAWGLYALGRSVLGRGRGGPLFAVLVRGKVGYIDRGGTLVIPATFGALKTPDAITGATPPPILQQHSRMVPVGA